MNLVCLAEHQLGQPQLGNAPALYCREEAVFFPLKDVKDPRDVSDVAVLRQADYLDSVSSFIVSL